MGTKSDVFQGNEFDLGVGRERNGAAIGDFDVGDVDEFVWFEDSVVDVRGDSKVVDFRLVERSALDGFSGSRVVEDECDSAVVSWVCGSASLSALSFVSVLACHSRLS